MAEMVLKSVRSGSNLWHEWSSRLSFFKQEPIVEAEEQVEEVSAEAETVPEVEEAVEETEVATEEIEEENEVAEPVEEIAEEETEDLSENLTSGMPAQDDGQLTNDEVWELTEYLAIGETDELVRAEIIDGHIQIKILLGDNGVVSAAEYAPHLYSQVTDTFLEYGGWRNFTIDFGAFGSVTMNRSEAVESEYGPYFPMEVIEGRLR